MGKKKRVVQKTRGKTRKKAVKEVLSKEMHHDDIIWVAKNRKYYWKIVNNRARQLGRGILLTSETYSSRKACLASARAYHRRHPNHDFWDMTTEGLMARTRGKKDGMLR